MYAVLVGVTIALGLLSRRIAGLPHGLAKEPGDVLYATMAYWIARLVAPAGSWARAAVAATLFCFAIEVSQLYHAPWIEAVRDHRLGGLVLGHAFHATDLLCYVLGVAVGVGIERALPRWDGTR